MKLFKSIMTLAAAALFAACETDVDTPQLNAPTDFKAPVMSDCSNVIVNADNSDSENVIFSWTAADFGQPVQILYQVYLTNGSASALLGATNTTSMAVSKGDLNGVVINGLGAGANETVSVSAYVTAQVANTSEYEAIASAQTEKFTVTTYQAALKGIYLCGEFSGNWDGLGAPIFWETSGGSNIYTCMVDFAKGSDVGTDATHSYFKAMAELNWKGTNYGYDLLTPSWTFPENNDSNFAVPIENNTIYQVSINLTAGTIDATAIGNSIGLVGTFNDWGNAAADDPTFVYDYTSSTWKTGSVELEAGAEIKIRVDNAWNTNWGSTGKASTIVPGGVELDSDGNYTVSEAGTYIAVLHANRTPMVLVLQKQ